MGFVLYRMQRLGRDTAAETRAIEVGFGTAEQPTERILEVSSPAKAQEYFLWRGRWPEG